MKSETPTTKPPEINYGLRLLIQTDIVPKAMLSPLLDEAPQLVAILTAIVKKSRTK
ncbi:MAG: hypothetical protein QNL68_12245 [Akkermansiaceae bacterium]